MTPHIDVTESRSIPM